MTSTITSLYVQLLFSRSLALEVSTRPEKFTLLKLIIRGLLACIILVSDGIDQRRHHGSKTNGLPANPHRQLRALKAFFK